MVGVAGKSKGCTTCRRRKVRCDEGKPHCLTCIRGGRACEGYQRYPVFLNYTASGLEKRRPLEEAKSEVPGSTPTPPLTNSQEAHQSVPNVMSRDTALIANPSTPVIWTKGFLSCFWTNYSPRTMSSNEAVKGPLWLYLAMGIPNPTPILHKSLLALAVVRSGRAREDSSLVVEGQRFYGQAVRMLQKTLEDRQQILHEENLAAVRAMVLYEVCLRTVPILQEAHDELALRSNLQHCRLLVQPHIWPLSFASGSRPADV